MLGATHQVAGPGTYLFASWLFLRVLGLIYLAAFFSLTTQLRGLIGTQGILPVVEMLRGRRHWGATRFWRTPTLCWLDASDSFLLFLAWTGVILSLLLVIGIAPLPCLVLLWICYLSLFEAGNLFMGYQWDILLLETGFVAIFMAPLETLPSFPPTTAPPKVVIALMWWILFRLMFSSGVAKLRSGDATWRKLTALCHHYETQPLPTPIAWYAHQLPVLFHKVSTALMFVIEAFVPFFILGPASMRYSAAICFMALMLLIQVTGNYCFFNLLGIALSLLLLDDGIFLPFYRWLFPNQTTSVSLSAYPAGMEIAAGVVAGIVILLSARPIFRLFRFEFEWPKPLEGLVEFFESFRLVNSYGLFSVMTTERPEIIIEGSHDGNEWQAYEFKWKPGDIQRAPRFVAPHQPRLDWQMWFAALGYYQNHPWLGRFLRRLLEGQPVVVSLLKRNPFEKTKPRYVRAVIYNYRFTSQEERTKDGAWWKREWRGFYSPTIESLTEEPKRKK